ncbi:ABC transporter substrate-binding protein [Roseomonas fluvialis]|uniref:ABC transporter substrate-binding protein n=1 Tax=Roseomonas fluvialis TaxID=1750527 RepID=A0ABM7Y9K0_9PROT|nr:ABC transporter substrate-binding protein [Roseomonas fluvialis]BDG74748.1 ABC transporter substrate-binding protein [Roseomonas fluvialis]
MKRLLLALLVACAAPAQAQTLRIGMKAAVDGSDPHQSYSPNRNVQMHVYESLVNQDQYLQPLPGLAESWRVIDDTTWEFRLRDGVAFHDGTPLTAADIAFSLRRAADARGLRTYSAQLRSFASVEEVDARTVRIRTRGPAPLLHVNLTTIMIVSAAAVGANATEEDFNGGRAAVGTGPYRWVRFTPGSDVTLERAPRHWGPPEPWQRVVFRFIPNDSARVSALLAGDVDVVDAVPPALYGRVRSDQRSRLHTATSAFNLYMYIDSGRERSPFVTGADGQPLDRNPLQDRRVRLALSHAINRAALAERAMEGGAEAAGQIAPQGFMGHVPGLPIPTFDPPRARALLAEAGYPQGFGLTIHCTSDRFAGDGRTCQALGQMLTAIGIRTEVEAIPSSIFFRRANRAPAAGGPEFSVSMSMFASTTGAASEGMNNILRTYNPDLSHGPANRGRYSDATLDGLLGQIERTMDDAQREALTQQAVRRVMEEAAIVPIFFVRSGWGTARNLTLIPRGDQYTMATGIRVAR